jgi:glycosyltransferase involved in cell wall biosynthesis
VVTIVGDGPSRRAIEQTAQRLGVGDRVRLRGQVSADELRSWYQVADVFATLSREESFGLTVLEAASWGAPVVASDIPTHRESLAFVGPGRIELLSASADGPRLAQAIRSATTRGRSIDRTGWTLPTWDRMVDRLLESYDEITQRSAGHRRSGARRAPTGAAPYQGR